MVHPIVCRDIDQVKRVHALEASDVVTILERIRAAVLPLSATLRAHTWDAMAAQIAACGENQA